MSELICFPFCARAAMAAARYSTHAPAKSSFSSSLRSFYWPPPFFSVPLLFSKTVTGRRTRHVKRLFPFRRSYERLRAPAFHTLARGHLTISSTYYPNSSNNFAVNTPISGNFITNFTDTTIENELLKVPSASKIIKNYLLK